MLTTVDNPYDPHKEYSKWSEWDEVNGYFTSQYLARMMPVGADEIDDESYDELQKQIVYEIILKDSEGRYKII